MATQPEKTFSLPITCRGGLEQSVEAIAFGTDMIGFARTLQNFEPATDGGYRRVSGYSKYDSNTVPGTTNNPITGGKVALGGVFAVRKLLTDNAIYFSSGSGWGSKLNAGTRTGAVSKSRFISYSITEPVVILTDGINPAWKHNGSVETIINGTGAPATPKYAALHLSRLVLAPASNTSSIALSAPNTDTDFSGANGAIEMNVGDVVTGLFTFRDTLYIFCKNSIFKLNGNSSTNFTITKVTDSIGCLSHDTIQEIAGDLVYLSTYGVRTISGTERIGDIELATLSKSIQPLLSSSVLGLFSEDVFSSCSIRPKSQYRLFVNNANVTADTNTNFLARFSRGESGQTMEWATLYGFKPYWADSEYINDVEYAVFGDPTNGYVYRMESGASFDGMAIQWIYNTPWLTFGDVRIRKRLHKIDVFCELEGSVDLTVLINFNNDARDIVQPRAVSLNAPGSFTLYGSAVYGSSVYDGAGSPVLKTNIIGSGYTASVIFSGTGGSSFTINSMNLLVAPKGRR